MTIDISFQWLAVIMLVFCRMAGMILFNPILSRQNVPVTVKVGLVLGLTLLIAPTVQGGNPVDLTDLSLLFAMSKELFVGFVCGMVFQIYFYMLFFAGDIMDISFGLSMAKMFDPGTNIQASMSSKWLQIIFVLYLFFSNSHLVLIRIFTSSYMIIPVGAGTVGTEISSFILELFVSAFSLAVRLVLPFVAAEVTLEVAMGVLMKLIPQINVFVINLQFEILLGLILLFLFSGPVASFVDSYTNVMLQSIEKALYALQ